MSRVKWSQAVSPLACQVPPAPAAVMPATSLLDRFAEELSDHGDIARASNAIRVASGVGQQLFASICKRLGEQAQ